MSTFGAVTVALFVFASLWLLVQALVPMGKIIDPGYGPRVTRLILWRGLRAMAVWQAAVGLVLIGMGSWETSPALFGMSLLLAGTASLKRRGLL